MYPYHPLDFSSASTSISSKLMGTRTSSFVPWATSADELSCVSVPTQSILSGLQSSSDYNTARAGVWRVCRKLGSSATTLKLRGTTVSVADDNAVIMKESYCMVCRSLNRSNLCLTASRKLTGLAITSLQYFNLRCNVMTHIGSSSSSIVTIPGMWLPATSKDPCSAGSCTKPCQPSGFILF